ncbi:hypothetical protein LJX78_00090 [Methanimicrococcus blatticola]|nr:hypothetical protein [Methanimicrococcus blatticola]MBZ3935864.1 hypothetical protein [Methanimicrococcus blatticola]MCC2508015.1 hypothetical protein [Methanimicrococcus blatticola]
MKKIIQILTLLLVIFIAVGVSGCLGGDDADNSTGNNPSNNSTGIDDDDLNYSTNIVTVRDLPTGFEFLSTQMVKSHGEGIGMTDILSGYRGYYKFTNDSVSNATVYFYCFKTNSTEDAAKYSRQMKDSYIENYGDSGTVSTVKLNGHDATKFTTTAENGSDMIVWTRSNLIFVTKGQVAGQIDYATLESLVIASEL